RCACAMMCRVLRVMSYSRVEARGSELYHVLPPSQSAVPLGCHEMTSTKTLAARALEEGAGILRLAPAWVPRAFCRPGRRLKLHPDDYYALGAERGGIDERWLASTVRADNGPLTAENEGMSEVVTAGGERLLLAEAIDELGA